MCSIFGVISECAIKRKSVFYELEKGLRHRGPDGLETFVHGDAMIGQHSLSITGQHSLPHKEWPSVYSLNGEIYNFEELGFGSEVEAIAEKGAAALNGPFAIAEYDMRWGSVLFKRDRLGEKPLYYFWKDGILAWASEQTALANAVGARRKESVVMRSFYPIETSWWDVEEVKPGTTVLVDIKDDIKRTKTFWRMPKVDETMPFDVAVHKTQDLLTKACERVFNHTDGTQRNVPAILCSGGVDSSIVTTVVKTSERISQSAAHWRPAYCLDIGDDLMHARAVAQAANRSRIKRVEPSRMPSYDETDMIVGEASTDPGNPLFHHLCNEMKKDGVRCFMTGDGGDDLFLGYPWHTKALRRGETVDRKKSLEFLTRCILTRADRISGSLGMESRTPYTDVNLVEHALKVPQRFHLDERLAYPGKTTLCAAFHPIVPLSCLVREKGGLVIT